MGILGRKVSSQAASAAGLSIIAVGVTLRGDLDSNGTVKVEGAIEGHVRAERQVLVARGGVVHGDVAAQEAIVGGTVQGAIRAAERVELQCGAVVQGDITTRRIAVAEGATLNGLIRMGEAAVAARPGARSDLRPATTQPPPSTTGPPVPAARLALPPRESSSGAGFMADHGDQH
jgi:cytoskeletal protein CcmA (bactofilin family)